MQQAGVIQVSFSIYPTPTLGGLEEIQEQTWLIQGTLPTGHLYTHLGSESSS